MESIEINKIKRKILYLFVSDFDPYIYNQGEDLHRNFPLVLGILQVPLNMVLPFDLCGPSSPLNWMFSM